MYIKEIFLHAKHLLQQTPKAQNSNILFNLR